MQQDDTSHQEHSDGWDSMVETFLRSINHELRTPLTSVLGYTELLRVYERGAGEGFVAQLDQLRRTSRRLADRVDDLLELARTVSGRATAWPREVDLGPLVRDAATSNARITVHVPDEAAVFADPEHVERIVHHLLDNALQHTHPPARVTVTATRENDVVHLLVADDGAGLEGTTPDMAFVPFRQGVHAGSAPSPGLGIGLSIVRELATLNDGDATLAEDPGGGVRAEVTLPATSPTGQPHPTVLLLREVIETGPRMVYQPIVDLETSDVIGYEALARGPAGSQLEQPDRLFAAARSLGLLRELDWACRLQAARRAVAAGMQPPLLLFGNVEPATLGLPSSPSEMQEIEDLLGQLAAVVEFTERDLLANPAEVLQAAERIRALGARLALDDVGADPASAAFLPLLRPDVVKLDMALVRREPTASTARTIQAVRAYVEESGARLLAEGIEDERHWEKAVALGADLGQGWFFGRPDDLPTPPPVPRVAPVPRTVDPAADAETPFDTVAQWESLRTSRKPLLVEISKELERFALQSPDDVLLLSTFQQHEQFTELTSQRYATLAEALPLVAAMAVDMPPDPAPGVRGTELPPADRLANEWTVAVLGNHVSAALIAVDLGDDKPEHERRFQHVLTHHRPTVTAAARCMVRRLAPV